MSLLRLLDRRLPGFLKNECAGRIEMEGQEISSPVMPKLFLQGSILADPVSPWYQGRALLGP